MEKIKEIWSRFLAWLLRAKDSVVKLSLTVWRFLKKWGVQIVNVIVLFIAYGSISSTLWADFIVGFWLFLLLAYYIFGKIFGAEKLFKRDE